MSEDNTELEFEMPEQEELESKPVQYFKLIELIDEIRQIKEVPYGSEFNFSILIEQDPTDRKYTYTCKVLAIIMREKTLQPKTTYIHYDEITKHGLNYLNVKKKRNQKVGINTPSFIDGSSDVESYKESEYIKFNFRLPNKNDLYTINKIRQKYNIPVPIKFKSEKLSFKV